VRHMTVHKKSDWLVGRWALPKTLRGGPLGNCYWSAVREPASQTRPVRTASAVQDAVHNTFNGPVGNVAQRSRQLMTQTRPKIKD